MAYTPSTRSIECPYCGHAHVIPRSEEDIEELDFDAHLERLAATEPAHDSATVRCSGCGAETTLATDIVADECPFCGAGLVAESTSTHQLRPRSLLPFAVNRDEALDAFRGWVRGLWFVPAR
jgi:predicted RNA-binding Zn-ribbon protein involved in translation (DUF1610 family)